MRGSRWAPSLHRPCHTRGLQLTTRSLTRDGDRPIEGLAVGDLVNGASIVFETADGQGTLDFFHFAFERHAVIDADGAPFATVWKSAAALAEAA